MANSVVDRGRAIGDVELAEYARDVSGHCVRTDRECRADFLVGVGENLFYKL
jgi:hypothetical protein